MENNMVITLTNSSKASFFYCHKQLLPMDHKYRRKIKVFFVGKVENNVAPLLWSREKLYDVGSKYNDVVFGFQFGMQKFLRFGLTYNWVKRSIFWALLY